MEVLPVERLGRPAGKVGMCGEPGQRRLVDAAAGGERAVLVEGASEPQREEVVEERVARPSVEGDQRALAQLGRQIDGEGSSASR